MLRRRKTQSFYSYALNRKNSAFTYSGLALRFSITLGLHRNITYNPDTRPVDIENRRRVWWTVYTFDRLCSSKLGHPVMIKDEDIDAPLPSSQDLTPEERDEFVDADQLIANIKLSRITGSILDLIYGIPTKRESGFVRNVHKILTALKGWDATLPMGLKLNHAKVPSYSSRSVASLRLHFNQVRPLLFYQPPPVPYQVRCQSPCLLTAGTVYNPDHAPCSSLRI
jgi:proline utilization trans-activator